MTRSALCQRFLGTLPIRTRDARVVRLSPWASQQKVLTETVLPRLEKKEKVWLIILKARRLGMSTLMEALMLWRAVEQDYVMSMVIAHEVPATKRIWQMTKLMVTHHPVLSKVGKVVGNSISFQHSLLDVATAGSPAASRSADFTCLHLSEVAFWPHPEAMLAALQCVPEAYQSFVAIESTANGKVGDGELFYEEWRRAVEGDSDFLPIFLPWHEFPDYQKPPSSIFYDTALDAEEQALKAEFKLSDAQLAWRRYCIATKCQGEVEKFHQEYPSTAEEAFIQSGLPFFSSAQLLPLHKELRAGTRCRVDETGRLVKDPTGPLEVFRFPEAGHQYVIGADPSMGVEDSDRSRSAACILDMESQEQVGEYDSPAAPHVFAKHLAGMGRAYHDALLCPEVQASGGGGGREVVVYLKEQLNYWNLHIWRHADRIRRERGVLFGWETNARTRPRMLARVREAVMEGSAVIHSAKLLRQLADFGENDSGRLEARVGHDDLLFAWGIALMSRSENYFTATDYARTREPSGVQLYGVPMAEALDYDLEKHRQEVLHGKANQQRGYLWM